jgi:hypothetical protein
MLLISTFSAVSNTAQITCNASFFAPCGITVPLSLLPPTISNADISSIFPQKEELFGKKLGLGNRFC